MVWIKFQNANYIKNSPHQKIIFI